ncbi:MAG: ABC transporter ATP-binding protein [bacterium]
MIEKNRAKQTLKIYWQHTCKYKFVGFFLVFSVMGASLTNVIRPLFFKQFFDILSSQQDKGLLFEALFSVLMLVLITEIIEWCFWRMATYTAIKFQAKIMADIANRCFQYLHKHSFSYFNNNFVGSLVKRVNRFVYAFMHIADVFIWNLLQLSVNIIFIGIILTYKNWILGLIVIGWITLFLSINWFFTKYKLKYDIKRSEADTAISQVLADTITNQSNVKLFCGYQREVSLFERTVKKATKLRCFTWTLDNIFEAIQGALMISLEIGILYMGMILWRKGLFTVGDFVLLQSYALTIFMRVWDFGRIIRRIYENLADAEEMSEILDTPHEIQDLKNAKQLQVKKGKIQFQNVTFCYNKTRCVLQKLNLAIKPKEKLALIGPSGAGKTTMVKLLLRMHDVTGGKILIDGQQVKAITQESLWQHISMVPQDPILFHRSLMENIRYGKPEATDEQVFKASKLAHCHEFISEFPDGYETKVGERGVKLSGGERQRVAIARAILRNAPILVLDEATSSLDSESEHLIQSALDTLMKNKTVIVIAHRLSTIMKVDRIIVVDQGGIVEQGTHIQLLKKKTGMYNKLWKIQAGGFVE